MAEDRATPATLWRHRDFLKLWTGETISVFGSQFSGIAIPIVAVLTLDASPSQMGLLAALGTAPFLLFGLVVGVWVDRLPRRPILIVADVGRGALIGLAAFAALTGLLTFPVLYVVSFFGGVFTVFFDVAYQAYLPSLVDRSQLVEANSKLETTRAASQVAGPSLGGLIVQWLSAGLAMLIDAASFFVSVAFLLAIRKREVVERTGRASMWREAREGLGTVFGDRRLRAIAGCTATANFWSAAFFAVYVLYAVVDLRLAPDALGLVFGVGSVGALLGAVVAGRIAKVLGVGPTIVYGSLLFGVGAIPIAYATPALAVPFLIAGQIFFGMGSLIYNINQVSLRQAITPHRLQGRMNATMRFLVWGTLPLGAIAGGILGELLPSLRVTIALAGIGAAVSSFWILFSPVRSLHTVPTSPRE